MVPLAQRLREALAERGMSQRRLARQLAGPEADERRVENERRQIAKYLAGQHAPTLERARALAAILEKPPDYFVDADAARTRLIDQVRGMADLLDELKSAVDDAALDEMSTRLEELAGRLRSLEATIDAQGRSTTLALEALTEGIRQLAERLEAGAAPTKRRGGAAR